MKTSIIANSTYNALKMREIKSHIRMNFGETREDDFLLECRDAAETLAEQYLNRKVSKQTLKLYLDDFPEQDYIELPYPPLIKIPSSGLRYTNSSGQTQTFSSTKWSSDIVGEPGRLVLGYDDDWPTDTLATNNPISVEYECGYGSTVLGAISSTNVKLPPSVKHAMLMTVASWYEGREDYIQSGFEFKKMPLGSERLMYPYRIKTF
jgi:uncharacterized phiE125 gp8 family phage protein